VPEDDAAHDADVLHVIAAMSASHGEVQEVQACQEKPKKNKGSAVRCEENVDR
jgi:hypothetical protein